MQGIHGVRSERRSRVPLCPLKITRTFRVMRDDRQIVRPCHDRRRIVRPLHRTGVDGSDGHFSETRSEALSLLPSIRTERDIGGPCKSILAGDNSLAVAGPGAPECSNQPPRPPSPAGSRRPAPAVAAASCPMGHRAAHRCRDVGHRQRIVRHEEPPEQKFEAPRRPETMPWLCHRCSP